MTFRVIRLVAVASVLAFGLTVRAVATAHAHADDPAADPQLSEPSPDAVEPPPADIGQPEPSDDRLDDTVGDTLLDDTLGDTPTGDTPVAGLEPVASDASTSADEAVPPSTVTPVPGSFPINGDPAASEPSAAEPIDPSPSASPSPTDVSALPDAPTTTPSAPFPADSPPTPNPSVTDPVVRQVSHPLALAPLAVAVHTVAPAPVAVDAPLAQAAETPGPVGPEGMPRVNGVVLLDRMEPVPAGIVAGLAVTNRVPASVAVAVEFGRTGAGWAGAIVFNLWLGRQLRERRMSQRQLAALSGVDHSTISRLLHADRRPSLTTATKLAAALRHAKGEPETADYFDRVPEETFPARRVEMALRADELLDDEEVARLMSIYLEVRRAHQAKPAHMTQSSPGGTSARAAAAPIRATPEPRG